MTFDGQRMGYDVMQGGAPHSPFKGLRIQGFYFAGEQMLAFGSRLHALLPQDGLLHLVC